MKTLKQLQEELNEAEQLDEAVSSIVVTVLSPRNPDKVLYEKKNWTKAVFKGKNDLEIEYSPMVGIYSVKIRTSGQEICRIGPDVNE